MKVYEFEFPETCWVIAQDPWCAFLQILDDLHLTKEDFCLYDGTPHETEKEQFAVCVYREMLPEELVEVSYEDGEHPSGTTANEEGVVGMSCDSWINLLKEPQTFCADRWG